MSALHGKTNRQMLPRWKTSDKAAKSTEFAALKQPQIIQSTVSVQLKETVDDFSKNPNLGVAADVISSAMMAGQQVIADTAARYVLEHSNAAPKALLRLARDIVDPASNQINVSELPSAKVANTRALLRLHPDNPMLWSDMARHYASMGDKKHAKRCMQTALQLAPNHRWLIRTMSRFMVHQGDPISAHKLLSNHPRTRADPWLIAAELACAQVAGRSPKFWRQATDILKRDMLSPFHISELATAVAMMELAGSERKKAKKLIQKGLISPTENTLAQVFWAKENKHLNDAFKLDELVESANDAYEADYQLNLTSGRLLQAMVAAKTWNQDEPFAARPKAEIAYVASLLDDYDLTIRMVNEVKKLDGQIDLNLEMNKTYAVLSSGRLTIEKDLLEIERIRQILVNLIDQGGENSYHAMANLGLWQYRYGEPEVGKQIYINAIEMAQKHHLRDAATMAATFAAREAILAGDRSASDMLEKAKLLTKKSENTASIFYLKKLDKLIINPAERFQILSANSAVTFINAPQSVPKMKLEKTKDGFVLWLPPNQK